MYKPAAATAAAVTEAWAGAMRLRDLFPEPTCFILIVFSMKIKILNHIKTITLAQKQCI